MRIGDLISRSWEISLKYKSLWLLGLLAEAAWLFSALCDQNNSWDFAEGDFFLSGVAVTLVFALLLLMLVLLVLHFLSVAGLIDSVNRITRGGEYKLSLAFAAGCRVFWRFVGLWLVAAMAGIGLAAALTIPIVLLFLVSKVLGVLSLIVAVPALLIGVFVIYNIYALTQRVIVARDGSIGDALAEAYWLFRHNPGPNVAVFLIYMVMAIAITLAAVVLILLIAAPFVAMALSSTGGKIVAIILGLPLVLAVLLVIEGIAGVFFNCLYTLFYFGLVEPNGVAAAPPPVHPL